MGYRSDVGLALCKEAAAILKSMLKEAKVNERYLFDHADHHDVDDDSGDELWRWESVKWYDGYPEVDFVTNFLHELDPSSYLLVRVGEQYDDIELGGDYWTNAFGLDVARNIVTSISTG